MVDFMSELADLYYYLESKTILHPIHGRIQFKLFPYQMEFLKEVHENDRLLIIKGRQIGATTMLAGYYAWRFQREGVAAVINSIKMDCTKDFYRKVQWFEPDVHRLYTDGRGLRAALNFYDEWNYNQNCGKPYDHVRFLQTGKHIITGTVDQQNKLYNLVVELTGRENPYRVVWFPVSRCHGAWDYKRRSSVRPYFTDRQWRMEMECCWE